MLPDRELNPGPSRDRAVYSPLYYRGFWCQKFPSLIYLLYFYDEDLSFKKREREWVQGENKVGVRTNFTENDNGTR
jgi:hypothetical protein